MKKITYTKYMKFLIIFLMIVFSINLKAENTSQSARSKQGIYLALNLGGYGPSPNLVFGGTLGLYLSTNIILDFEYLGGTAGSTSTNLFDYATVQTNSKMITLKVFTGNSFYFRLGAGIKGLNYNLESISVTNSSIRTFQGSYKGEANFGFLAIGNQWQMSNFTIGCDWIGYSPILNWKVDNEVQNSTISTYYSDLIEADKKNFLKTAQPIVTRFYIGFSF